MADHRVALFTRYPKPGCCKTRLIPAVGAGGAAFCQTVMTERIVREAAAAGIPTEVWETGGDPDDIAQWLRHCHPAFSLKRQVAGGLGHKIAGAFDSAFAEGCDKLVIVGADIPSLTKAHISAAFDQLSETTPMVVQAALDGGYVLVGLRKVPPAVTKKLFVDAAIGWGGEDVLRQQLGAADAAGVRCAQINEALHDIDVEEDLAYFEAATGISKRVLSAPALAIVTPILNESPEVLVTNVRQWYAAAAHPARLHLVFADGGSRNISVVRAALTDGLRGTAAAGLPITWVEAPAGRGGQVQAGLDAVNAGAPVLGDVVMIVHADTLLPQGYDEAAVDVLRTPGVAGGAFRLAFDAPSWKTHLVEWGANHRAERLGQPYGDQAIFVFRHVLNAVGGMRRDYPLLEDVDLTARLRARGRVALAATAVVTSSRRYYKHGFLKILVSNQLVLLAYSLGVSPAALHRYYYAGAPLWWLAPVVLGVGVSYLTRRLLELSS
eukprot:TRINITY_DN7130_c0_g1_i2.p1 TRINITY_DN7130_c0_g1~~TRINITY_DN7130_c0_g1_i2.p1  ORF type:complete len:513 (+),score=139.50 TRINITY_DN7130_c0_g1_i2:59-1540(+)